MEPLPAGLILLAITTPAIIAYRHPKEYGRLAWALMGIGAVVMIFIAGWDMGYSTGVDDTFAFLTATPSGTKDQLLKHATTLSPYMLYLIIGVLYIWILTGLPLIGLVQKGSDK